MKERTTEILILDKADRTSDKKVAGYWKGILFEELKSGDIFRNFDQLGDGSVIPDVKKEDGLHQVFVCLSEPVPYINENKVSTESVQCLEVKGV